MPNFYNLLRARKFSTAADTAVEIAPYDSATPNFTIDAGGKLSWSSGSANADTNLYRSAANTLKTDDSFDVASGHTYKIDGADVLTSSSLGTTVLYSALTSVGDLTFLNAATPTFTGPTEISGTLSFQQTTEKVNTSSISSNVMTCDYTTGAIYYQSASPSANFTVNFTNVPTTDNKAITFTIFVTQGSTGYIPNVLQIDGTPQTIKWAQSATPTPNANKIDIFSFTLIRLSSSWTVFGNANTNF
jgi:hypothetical protein